MQLPELEVLFTKLSSKKFFTGLVAIVGILYQEMPVQYLPYKFGSVVVIAVTVVVCQTIIDKKEEKPQEPE